MTTTSVAPALGVDKSGNTQSPAQSLGSSTNQPGTDVEVSLARLVRYPTIDV